MERYETYDGSAGKLSDVVPLLDLWSHNGFCGIERYDGTRVALFVKDEPDDPFAQGVDRLAETSEELARLFDAVKDGTEIFISVEAVRRPCRASDGTFGGELSSMRCESVSKEGGFEYTSMLGIDVESHGKRTSKVISTLGYRPAKPSEVVEFVYRTFNPDKRRMKRIDFDASVFKDSDTLLESFYESEIDESVGEVRIGATVVRSWSVTYPPSRPHEFSADALFSDIASHGLDFRVFMNIRKGSYYIGSLDRKISNSKGSIFNFVANENPIIVENARKMIDAATDRRVGIVSVALSVSFMGNEREMEDFEPEFDSVASVRMMRDDYRPVEAWFCTIPGLIDRNLPRYLTLGTTAFMTASVPNFRIESAPTTFINPSCRAVASAMFYDERRTVNSAIITAKTGRGKSVLVNMILAEYLSKFENCDMLVVDYGGSNRNLVKFHDRFKYGPKIAYTAPEPDSGFRLNPFDLDFGVAADEESIARKMPLAVSFLETAVGVENEEEKAVLASAVEEAYVMFILGKNGGEKKRKDSASKPWIDIYNDSGFSDRDAFVGAMPTISDISFALSKSRTIRSEYGDEAVETIFRKINTFMKMPFSAPFSGTSTEIVTDSRIVLDIKPAVMGDPTGRLAALLFLFFSNSMLMKMTRSDRRDRRKIVVMDEYPRLVEAFPTIASYHDMLLKTGRKEKIDTFAIAQNITTFDRGLFENIGSYITFRPETSNEKSDIADYLSLSKGELDVLDKIDSVKGVYSEIIRFDMERNGARECFRITLSDGEKGVYAI